MYKDLQKMSELEFDYEVNSAVLDELEDKVYCSSKYNNTRGVIDFSKLNDRKEEIPEKKKKDTDKNVKINYAWCLKRLVSKQKRRFENEDFDLDLSYVTKRVIAMGYPSQGFETIYRNKLADVINFFERMHHNQVKVYNLCIEKDRIYPKTIFPPSISVGLFPSKDHNPCPIKLIVEFCVDISLFLLKNENAIAAIHCKAGKGRTGVMICCYLIFTGLCANAEAAIKYYGKIRTHNGKGVTIPSQIKYIQYFEAYLMANYSQPYINMIPRIIRSGINQKTKNMIENFINDDSYFIYHNKFTLNYTKIGPFSFSKNLTVTVYDYQSKVLSFPNKKFSIEKIDEYDRVCYYFKLDFVDKVEITSDIKITVKGYGVDFYFWVNLWYCTIDLIKTHIDEVKVLNNNYYFKEEMDLRNFVTSEENQDSEENESNRQENSNDNIAVDISPDKMDEKPVGLEREREKEREENNNVEIVANEANNEKDSGSKTDLDSAKEPIVLKNSQPSRERKASIIKIGCIKKKSYLKENSLSDSQMKPSELDKLSDIFERQGHDKNLNPVINAINPILQLENKRLFNTNNLNIYLLINELDKFHQAKKMLDRFYVRINYSLNK